MKRVLSIFFALCITLAVMADAKGHYWLDVEEQNIPVENITDYFSAWFNLGDGVTFTVFNDETDNIGMRHIAYQQYINGVKAEHQMILVHARDGKIVSVNTSIIETKNQPKSVRPSLSKKQAKEQVPNSLGEAELLIITCTIDGVETSRLAYKTIDFTTHEDVYIDAETGDVIKRISRIHSADVQGRGNTMYHGWQDMTMTQTNGYYTLADSERNILTIDASASDVIILNSFDTNNYTPDNVIQAGQEVFKNYLSSCDLFASTTSTWNNTAMLQAVSISIINSDWFESAADLYPDLYFKIYDNHGSFVYQSSIIDDSEDALIYIPNGLPLYSNGYTIEIYDQDPIGEDDLGEVITISSIYPQGIKSWQGTNTVGSLIIGKPELDAHWGMEKTYDFYKGIFGRNSYDNNGSLIYQFISPDISECPYNNAGAINWLNTDFEKLWPPYICYGKVDGVIFRPLVSLDLVAHEFTHLVTAYNNGHKGLVSQGESGALNESFSDIMGFSVENYVLGDNDYLIGEDVMIDGTNTRSLKTPKLSCTGAQPNTYNGEYWGNPQDSHDAGYIHPKIRKQSQWQSQLQ